MEALEAENAALARADAEFRAKAAADLARLCALAGGGQSTENALNSKNMSADGENGEKGELGRQNAANAVGGDNSDPTRITSLGDALSAEISRLLRRIQAAEREERLLDAQIAHWEARTAAIGEAE